MVRLRVIPLLAAVLLCLPPAAAASPPVRPGAPISAHAMVYTCCTPLAMKELIFAEAKSMGARFIRVDVELGGIFPAGEQSVGDPEWARFDEVLALSRQYELPVLGIFQRPPGAWPPDPQVFGGLAAEVAAHARGTIEHWEILNEPVLAYRQAAEPYAHLLRAAHDAIRARVPEAQIALGSDPYPAPGWIDRVFATPGADAAHAFDIANVNIRDATRHLPARVAAWRATLARHGFTGPIWVTEHGYPGDSAYQSDPAFRGGEPAQASYLTESVLTLAAAGASEVFVTLRDNHSGRWASEGVVHVGEVAPFAARRKPAFAAVRRLVDRWDELVAAWAERGRAEARAWAEMARSAAWRRRAAGYRDRARTLQAKIIRLRAWHSDVSGEPVRDALERRIDRTSQRARRRQEQTGWARAMAELYELRAALHGQRARELAAFVAGG